MASRNSAILVNITQPQMPVATTLKANAPQQESPPARRKVRTCRHWVRGICVRGADDCNFLHAFTDPRKQGLCDRQLKGECTFGVNCYYQHLPCPLTDYIAAARGTSSYVELCQNLEKAKKGEINLSNIPELKLSPLNINVPYLSKSAPPSPQMEMRHRKIKTCRAWANGKCPRSNEQCDFLHAWTDPQKAGICHRHMHGVCGYSAEKCYHQHINIKLEQYVAASQGTKSYEELIFKLEEKKGTDGNKENILSADGPRTISQRLGLGVFKSFSIDVSKTPRALKRDASPLLHPVSLYPCGETSKWNQEGLSDSKSVPGDDLRSPLFQHFSFDPDRKLNKISSDDTKDSISPSRRNSLAVPDPFRDGKSVADDSSTCSEMPDLGSDLRKLLMEKNEELKLPTTTTVQADGWEVKAMIDWTPDDVADFVLSLGGKSECWNGYAKKLKDAEVDGKTLTVYDTVDEFMEDGYGLNRPHARVLLKAIKDLQLKEQNATN